MVLHQPGEHPADCGEIHAGTVDGPGQKVGQGVPVRSRPLGLAECLANQTTPPERQPARDPRIGCDGRAHVFDDEISVALIGQYLMHQRPSLGIDERRNLFYRQDEVRTKSFAANLDLVLVLIAADMFFRK